MGRRPQRPGISYYDSNAGCLIEEAPDLLDMKRRIRELWPDVQFKFHFDFDQQKHIVVQVLEDGSEELVLLADELDERIIERLWKGRPDRPDGDVLSDIDKFNAELEREQERRFEEQLGDAGERLAFALKKDGLRDHEDISRSKPRKRRRRGPSNLPKTT